jgi:hypothetical protein
MEPFKPFYAVAQEKAMKVTQEFLEAHPELQAVSVLFVWDIDSQDLPNGVFLPRKEKFGMQTVFRFMDAVAASMKYLFLNVTKGLKTNGTVESRPRVPDPSVHNGERPEVGSTGGDQVRDRGDGHGAQHAPRNLGEGAA